MILKYFKRMAPGINLGRYARNKYKQKSSLAFLFPSLEV